MRSVSTTIRMRLLTKHFYKSATPVLLCSPTIVVGILLLLGTNSYITTSNGSPLASYVSYMGNDAVAINSLVSEWGAIPEPSTFILTTVSWLALLVTVRLRLVSSRNGLRRRAT